MMITQAQKLLEWLADSFNTNLRGLVFAVLFALLSLAGYGCYNIFKSNSAELVTCRTEYEDLKSKYLILTEQNHATTYELDRERKEREIAVDKLNTLTTMYANILSPLLNRQNKIK